MDDFFWNFSRWSRESHGVVSKFGFASLFRKRLSGGGKQTTGTENQKKRPSFKKKKDLAVLRCAPFLSVLESGDLLCKWPDYALKAAVTIGGTLEPQLGKQVLGGN